MCIDIGKILYGVVKGQVSVFTELWSLININPSPAETGYAPVFSNSVDPAQLTSEEANRSGSALFVIQYVSLSQQSCCAMPLFYVVGFH